MNSPDHNIIIYLYNCMTYKALHCVEETSYRYICYYASNEVKHANL